MRLMVVGIWWDTVDNSCLLPEIYEALGPTKTILPNAVNTLTNEKLGICRTLATSSGTGSANGVEIH